jgi:hypothetical protein
MGSEDQAQPADDSGIILLRLVRDLVAELHPQQASRRRGTHWRTGSLGKTWSTRYVAVSAIRQSLHDGHTALARHENAMMKSRPQCGRLARPKPQMKNLYLRYLRKSRSTNAVSMPQELLADFIANQLST